MLILANSRPVHYNSNFEVLYYTFKLRQIFKSFITENSNIFLFIIYITQESRYSSLIRVIKRIPVQLQVPF